jgi:glycosyltransferase involved in cell wall biosynthesis
MKASVVIATWNRAGPLAGTLARFRDLRVPPGVDWELVVVNNNCTDDTDAVVRSFQGKLPVVLAHQPVQGLVPARNKGAEVARGEFILFTDDDVYVHPDWVTETLAAFDRFAAGLVFGKITLHWETPAPAWFGPQFAQMLGFLDPYPEPRVCRPADVTPHGANLSVRRTAFDAVGGFDRRYGVVAGGGYGNEDNDLVRRVHAAGFPVAYTPRAGIEHRLFGADLDKRLYRRRAWRGSTAQVDLLRAEAAANPALPRVMGLPRYYLRVCLGHLADYLRAVGRRDPGLTFYNELRVIRLAGLVWFAATRRPRPAAHSRGAG